MDRLMDDEHRRGGSGRHWEDEAGAQHRRANRHPDHRAREERDEVRLEADLKNYHQDAQPRRVRDRTHEGGQRRGCSSKEHQYGRDDSPSVNAAPADVLRSERPRAQELRGSYSPQQSYTTIKKAIEPARQTQAPSSSQRTFADGYIPDHPDEREHVMIGAKGRQGSRKTSVTFLPAFIAESPTSGGGPRRVVDDLTPRSREYEHAQTKHAQRAGRSSSAPYHGQSDDLDLNPRHHQLSDELLRAPAEAQRPRMRYPPTLSRLRQPLVSAAPPSTSTYGWTERDEAGSTNIQARKGHLASPSHMQAGYPVEPEMKEMEWSSGYRDHIRHARTTVEPGQPNDRPAYVKEVLRYHDSPVPGEYSPYPEKQVLSEPGVKTSALSQPQGKAAKVYDPYTRVQAIRERTGYEARTSTSSYVTHLPSSTTAPTSMEQERAESDQRSPPIPVKPRREVVQSRHPTSPVQDDDHGLGLAFALCENARTASVVVPDDPAPMYTELPTEGVVYVESTSTVADAPATGPADDVRVPTDTPERKEAVERMDDMEDEITCPM